jgi:signal transduction histidine kinase/ActR/RegA family two-component response regulator
MKLVAMPRPLADLIDAVRRSPTAVAGLPTASEFEQETQRGSFETMLWVMPLAAMVFSIVFWLQEHQALAQLNSGVAGIGFACALWARRGDVRWPMRISSAVMVALLAWQALLQGPSLPAAAWWLSVMPLILAAAGLYVMAIATVAAFVGVVTWLFSMPVASGLGPDTLASVAPWRTYVAVVGSEAIALAVIVMSMRRRSAVTHALERARSAASDALASKSRFLANMSHEIRTPLNGVIATGELLRSPALDAAQRAQLLALQEDSAKSLLALVNDVLDWSKLEAGRVVIEAQPLNLRRIVSESNELFAAQAHAKGIELTSSANPDVPRLAIGDALRLRQIVNNLVSNAVKFTAKGGVHIHLSMETAAAPASPPRQRRVQIEVADSGIGIDAHKLDALFEAFTQADNSATRRYGGTGLGLSICRELAQMMGGRIDVSSSPGRGSTFTLTVPLEVRPERERPVPTQRRDVVLASTSPGVQRHLKSVLHDLGIEPLISRDLPAAPAGPPRTLLLIDAPLITASLPVQAWLRAQVAAGVRVAVIMPIGADLGLELPDGVLSLYKPVRRRALKDVLDALDARPTERPTPREAVTSVTTSRPHVLIVEDNPVNQVVVQAMLGELGATSVLAANGCEAILCLAVERFDLVLMDMQMPELDGLAATRAWRKTETATQLRRVPIVAMTANAPGEDAATCEAAGMDGFLAKPFGMVELRRVLETWGRAALPHPNPMTLGNRS